jgi:hypothetical protein
MLVWKPPFGVCFLWGQNQVFRFFQIFKVQIAQYIVQMVVQLQVAVVAALPDIVLFGKQ